MTNDLLLYEFPPLHEEIENYGVKQICLDFNLFETYNKIVINPPKNKFISDGCSMWFDSIPSFLISGKKGEIWRACFLHDIKYWCGYPSNNDTEKRKRMIVDLELVTDVYKITGSMILAVIMFKGVLVGGHPIFRNKKFSWGYGRL